MNRIQLNNTVKECLMRNRSAQEKLYNFSYQRMINIPLRYVRSKEDANWYFNLGMLKVFESLKTFSLDREYLPWARTILIRSTIDQLRKNNTFKATIAVVESTTLEDLGGFDLNLALANQNFEDILYLLQSLPDKQRIIFSLHEIDELKHQEIQDLTGIKINTSKWLLAKAKTFLKQKLTKNKNIGFGKT